MEFITALIEETLTDVLLSPSVLLLAALVSSVLLSGVGARLIDR